MLILFAELIYKPEKQKTYTEEEESDFEVEEVKKFYEKYERKIKAESDRQKNQIEMLKKQIAEEERKRKRDDDERKIKEEQERKLKEEQERLERIREEEERRKRMESFYYPQSYPWHSVGTQYSYPNASHYQPYTPYTQSTFWVPPNSSVAAPHHYSQPLKDVDSLSLKIEYKKKRKQIKILKNYSFSEIQNKAQDSFGIKSPITFLLDDCLIESQNDLDNYTLKDGTILVIITNTK